MMVALAVGILVALAVGLILRWLGEVLSRAAEIRRQRREAQEELLAWHRSQKRS